MADRRQVRRRDGARVTGLPMRSGMVNLRQLEPSDADELVTQANSRAVWRNLTHVFPHPYRKADAEEWIARCLEQDPPSALAIIVDDRLAGVCGIAMGEGVGRYTAKIGYWLGEDFWAQGIATTALAAFLEYVWDAFDVERLQAEVFAWNPASVRVLEKNGFVLEGSRRKAIYKDGELIDEWVYSLLRDDAGPQ